MTTAKPIIYLSIIEDNQFIRSGWEAILRNVPEFSIVGSFESCEDAFSTTAIEESDVILMDIKLPGISGIEGVRHVHKLHPKIAVIMCSVYDDDTHVFDAICAGAVGYLLKKASSEEIIKAIHDAVNGGSPMTPTIARKVIASFQPKERKSNQIQEELTEREQEVLTKMAQGKSYATIANELSISIDGVRFHIRNIYLKLQVHSRAEAIAEGLKQRIISPPR
ncbi:MAG: response regulator transcription factor [Ignavibacteriae bacterium]|nr:response regulator transcription factor [Ignavibacteriota bacterium]